MSDLAKIQQRLKTMTPAAREAFAKALGLAVVPAAAVVDPPAESAEVVLLKTQLSTLTERLTKIEGMPAQDRTNGAPYLPLAKGAQPAVVVSQGEADDVVRSTEPGAMRKYHREKDALALIKTVHASGGEPVTPEGQAQLGKIAPVHVK